MFYPQCLDAVKESMHSFAKQIASGGNLATAFSKLKTDTTNAYYGTSVVVTKNSFDDWIDWEKNDGIPIPRTNRRDMPDHPGFFTTQEIMGVLNYIAAEVRATDDSERIQKLESARGTWTNLLNSQQTQSDAQGSRANQLMSGESTELQSANQHSIRLVDQVGWLSELIRSLGQLGGA